MILKIIFSKPENGMRIDNQHYINGFIHKCLGKNNKYHNSFSDYAISSLQGGKLCNGRLVFNENPYILVSSENSNFINDLIAGILTTDGNIEGIKFDRFEFSDYNVNDYYDKIITLSPILIKDKSGMKLSFKDEKFLEVLTNNCIKKLKHAGIMDKSFKIKIRNINKSKVKKIMVGNVFNICSLISLVVFGKPKTRKTLYNLGIGNSCGCGFGTIKIYE